MSTRFCSTASSSSLPLALNLVPEVLLFRARGRRGAVTEGGQGITRMENPSGFLAFIKGKSCSQCCFCYHFYFLSKRLYSDSPLLLRRRVGACGDGDQVSRSSRLHDLGGSCGNADTLFRRRSDELHRALQKPPYTTLKFNLLASPGNQIGFILTTLTPFFEKKRHTGREKDERGEVSSHLRGK